MAVIIYGRRAYGRIHEHEGEYADTQFAHIDFVPLFPIASVWVTQDHGNGQRTAIPIKLNGKSVAATYLRIWAPPIALGLMFAPGLGAPIAGLVLAALSIWSWTWRSLRGDAARRRSDFNRIAWGSRCEPRWMPADTRERIAASLRDGLAKRHDARPPEDVARFGPRDVEEALYAYGMLRFSGVADRASDSAADRLLAAAFETAPAEGGPYREGAASDTGALGPEIAELIRTNAEAYRIARARLEAQQRKRWFRRPWVQLAGLILATPTLASTFAIAAMSFGSPAHLTAKQLDSTHPHHGRAEVTCDRIQDDGWQVLENDSVEQHVAFCWVGTKALPVVSADGDALPPATANVTLAGELRVIPDHPRGRDAVWVNELRADPDLDAHSFEVYLDRDTHDRWITIVISALFSGLVIAGWVFWIRALLRRRAAVKASA